MIIEKDRLPGLIQNSLSYTTDDDGYMTFLRFSEKQMAFYADNPFFHLMSTCSSGICLSFETDGNEVILDCRTADLNRKVLEQIKGEMTFGEILQKLGETVKKVNQARSRLDIIQHFDLYVDDHYLDAVRIGNDKINIFLCNPEHRRVHVRIWLPLYKPLSLRSVSSDAMIWPHQSDRPRLLAFGDSITQGFVAGKPSFSYVAQLAELLEMDAINQGIGNITHDHRILDDWDNLEQPDLITVAYGTNDWHSDDDLETIRAYIEAFYARLQTVFPRIPVYVITPIWRDDLEEPKTCGTFRELTLVIRQIAGTLSQVRLIDGLDISPHNPTCYSDGWLHPNITGFSYMAPRLYRIIKDWRAAGPA
ncbi:MAG: SGNH/GDSL hydrolase family protein [Bacillota bacterium]|nr:SGNH/GDSL hydrolase family protein [Bacillota bacterium]